MFFLIYINIDFLIKGHAEQPSNKDRSHFYSKTQHNNVS